MMAFKSKFIEEEKPKNAESLFRDLKDRKIEAPWSHQADMLRNYHKFAESKSDVALELPTGSGKTLIGLLIGEYRRRVYNDKVVFLCPTRQLVHQVVSEANNKYGIQANAFIGSHRNYDSVSKNQYLYAQSISVTTYSSLFNTNPYFKDPDLIILDDAHAVENYVAKQWSLEIDRYEHEDIFAGIFEIIKESISPYMAKIILGEERKVDIVDKIPTPRYLKLIPPLVDYLDVVLNADKYPDLYFPWKSINGHLQACHFYISRNIFLIRPLIPPSLTHGPFKNATQRIYMSATLGIGGDLERITGVHQIDRLPIIEGWDEQGFGRKFFVFPEVSISEEEAHDLAISMTEQVDRSLILVPSNKQMVEIKSSITKNTTNEIYSSEDLENSKEGFTSNSHAVAILANRFEGIDLAGDQCRFMLIKDFPLLSNIQEKFIESRLSASFILRDRIRTKVVQAIGRCTRSSTDYSVVCILGNDLTNLLINKDNIVMYHPELQAELTFGFEESSNTTPEEFVQNLKSFLSQDASWKEAEKEIIRRRNSYHTASLPEDSMLSRSVRDEIQYQYDLWHENYEDAIQSADRVLQILHGDTVKGYRGLWNYLLGNVAGLAVSIGSTEFQTKAIESYKNAYSCARDVSWLQRMASDLITIPKEEAFDPYLSNILERLEKNLIDLGTAHGKNFEKRAKTINDLLDKKEAKYFEEGHRLLGEILGYEAFNSNELSAPDPYWVVGDILCLVFEDKTDGDDNTSVSVSKTREAAGHKNWIRQNVPLKPDAEVITVMLTTASTIDSEAVPHAKDIYYWNVNDFRKWAASAINLIRRLRTSVSCQGNLFWKQKAAEEYMTNRIDPTSTIQYLIQNPLASLPTNN